jgi:glycosyltransferase involved in cell wall biosynthesis
MKLLEYMALGKAIVAPDQENIRDVLQDGEACFFTPGQVHLLSGALVRLATDRELRSQMGAQGRAAIVARRYNWKANAEQVLALRRATVTQAS